MCTPHPIPCGFVVSEVICEVYVDEVYKVQYFKLLMCLKLKMQKNTIMCASAVAAFKHYCPFGQIV